MTQLPLPESRMPVGTSLPSEKWSEIEKENLTMPASLPLPYVVRGPHAKCRTALMWVNRLLASDLNESVSGISVRELEKELSRFQKDMRVRAPGLRDPDSSVVSTPSRTGGPNPGSRSTLRKRTRNFKN